MNALWIAGILIVVFVFIRGVASGLERIGKAIIRLFSKKSEEAEPENGQKDQKEKKGRWVHTPVATIFSLLMLIALFVPEVRTAAFLMALTAVLSIIVILMLADIDAFFTKPPLGATTFINEGEDLKEIVPNVKGFMLSDAKDPHGRRWIITEKEGKKSKDAVFSNSLSGTVWFQKWLLKARGVKFMGFFWPHAHVHKFDLRKGGVRRVESPKATDDKNKLQPLRNRVVDDDERTKVDSLLFVSIRPIYLELVELAGDNSSVNLLYQAIYRQVIPVIPVYDMKGDFYTALDAAAEAEIIDFFSTHKERDDDGKEVPLTYKRWLELAKAGVEAPLMRHMRNFNISPGYWKKLENEKEKYAELIEYVKNEGWEPVPKPLKKTPKTPEDQSQETLLGSAGDEAKAMGIVPRFGFALVSLRLIGYEPGDESTRNLVKAILAREVKFHEAKGVREEAEGKKDGDIKIAEGEAARMKRPVEDLIGLGVTADVAAGVVETSIRTANIAGQGSKITTYIEGDRSGQGRKVALNLNTSAPQSK